MGIMCNSYPCGYNFFVVILGRSVDECTGSDYSFTVCRCFAIVVYISDWNHVCYNPSMEHVIETEHDMHEFAKEFLDELSTTSFVFLNGDLGSGKTTFVKGIGEALGIEEEITSPTFVLIKEYLTGKERIREDIRKIFHLDVYRLETIEELVDLGIEDLVEEPGVLVLVEWADKFEDFFSGFDRSITLDFSYGAGATRTVFIRE